MQKWIHAIHATRRESWSHWTSAATRSSFARQRGSTRPLRKEQEAAGDQTISQVSSMQPWVG
ncbi:MAG: hypothetical protein ABUU24_01510, partial [Variovorax sp.]